MIKEEMYGYMEGEYGSGYEGMGNETGMGSGYEGMGNETGMGSGYGMENGTEGSGMGMRQSDMEGSGYGSMGGNGSEYGSGYGSMGGNGSEEEMMMMMMKVQKYCFKPSKNAQSMC